MRNICILFIVLLSFSCRKPEHQPRNSDNILSAVWVTIPGLDENAPRYNGVFNATQDTVFITVPLTTPAPANRQIKLDSLRLRGSIPLDATVRPAMGLMNLSSPVRIEVVSGTQDARPYWIVAKQQ